MVVDAACLGQASIFTVISCFTPCICLYTCHYRSRLRAKYELQQTPCNDCCVHFWCLGCAMCQEYRELKNRGFDMHIGILNLFNFQKTSKTPLNFLLRFNNTLTVCIDEIIRSTFFFMNFQK